MTELNSTAPDFRLRSTSGEDVSLTDYRGKTVILAFFPATFTGVCQKEMCTFNDSLGKLNASNATVLGISIDGPHAQSAFAEQNQLNFPLLSDHQRKAARAYDVIFENFANSEGYHVAQRSIFIIDAEGSIKYIWLAPNPGVEPDYDAVIDAAASI